MSQEISQPCPACGHVNSMRIGQTVLRDKLRWYRSINCPTCGKSEEDGEGFPPEAIRRYLLAADGSCALQIEPQFRSAAAKVLRSALGLSLAEVSSRLSSLPDFFRGTRTEVEWLQIRAESEGAPATITAVCPTLDPPPSTLRD